MLLRVMNERTDSGFWVAPGLLAGISPHPDGFLAYVIETETAVLVESGVFPAREEALALVHSHSSSWEFQSVSQCGNGTCGKESCGTTSCPGHCGI